MALVQARDVRASEVVAIKKMSYQGKSSNEARLFIVIASLAVHSWSQFEPTGA